MDTPKVPPEVAINRMSNRCRKHQLSNLFRFLVAVGTLVPLCSSLLMPTEVINLEEEPTGSAVPSTEWQTDEINTDNDFNSLSSDTLRTASSIYNQWSTSSAETTNEDQNDGQKIVRSGPANGATNRGKSYRGESANVSRLLDSLLRGYDKRLRPNYGGQQVEVGITMFVSSISHISEVNMDFTMDFYFRQHWTDPRLNFIESGEDELCISNEMLGKIWWPDTFFANAKQANFHTATTRNAFLRISPSGMITQSLRLTVTPTCAMDLIYFPMDSQICSLEIESYAYSVKHIIYNWKDGPKKSIGIDDNLQLPQFSVKGFRAVKRIEELSTGNYSRLACQFYLTRRLGYYMIHIYIPSCLIVVLSWISFWLHRDASPARVALGITTVLTMTTVLSSSNASLPKISYLKSIDIYLVTCFVMVFASLLEYACVSFIGRSRSGAAPNGCSGGDDVISSSSTSSGAATNRSALSSSSTFTSVSSSHPRWFPSSGSKSSRRRQNTTAARDDRLLELYEAEASLDHTVGCDGPHVVSPTGNGSTRSEPTTTTTIAETGMKFIPTVTSSFSGHIIATADNDDDVNARDLRQNPLRCPPLQLPASGISSISASLTSSSFRHRNVGGGGERNSWKQDRCCSGDDYSNRQRCSGGQYERQQQQQQQQQRQRVAQMSASMCSMPSSRRGVALACAIDRYSRIVFPFVFLVFNIVYWIVYLQISSRPKDTDFIFFNP